MILNDQILTRGKGVWGEETVPGSDHKNTRKGCNAKHERVN